MPYQGRLKQSTARNATIRMVRSDDHVTGIAGLTLTITASKDGGAFASITPTVTDLGGGAYSLALTTGHTDTIGDLRLRITGGTDALDDEFVWSVEDFVVASVSGAVGSVTGAVGSVTGNVGGNVVGSVGSVVGAVGSVTGAVGSVTGAVGSVTGNVGGNVVGSVGSVTAAVTVGAMNADTVTASAIADNAIDAGAIATGALTAAKFAAAAITSTVLADGAITAAKFGAGAINAAAIATDAIDADALAADAVAEIQSGLATSSALASVQADTDNIQTRIPAALVGGRMDSSVGALAAGIANAIGQAHLALVLDDNWTPGSGSVAEALELAQGLAQDNYMLDEQIYSGTDLTSARIRFFFDAASVASATPGGTLGSENEKGAYQITVTYASPGKVSSYKVARLVVP